FPFRNFAACATVPKAPGPQPSVGQGKTMGRPPSVQTQLLALELGIALPLLGLIAFLLFVFDADEGAEARQSTLQLGQLAAADVQSFVRDIDAMLANVAGRPRVRAMDPSRCDPVFADYLAQHSRTSDLVLTDTRGRRVCSAASHPGGLPAEMVEALREAARSEGFASSRPFVDEATGRWSLSRARPVLRNGRVVGVLATCVDLSRFHAALSRLPLPIGVSLRILDRRGALITEVPEHDPAGEPAGRATVPSQGPAANAD